MRARTRDRVPGTAKGEIKPRFLHPARKSHVHPVTALHGSVSSSGRYRSTGSLHPSKRAKCSPSTYATARVANRGSD